MHEILHGSKEMPYFVRNQGKYPVIFDQPTLGIICVSLLLILLLLLSLLI